MQNSHYKIKRYNQDYQNVWDDLITRSKNSFFLFKRNFMDYHSDRFQDHSLLVFREENLVAVLPANIVEKSLYSHQGLTFGGLQFTDSTRSEEVLEIFDAIFHFCKEQGIEKCIYKAIPYIYHKLPCQEDMYALFRKNASLIRTDLTFSIDYQLPYQVSELRKRGFKKAVKANLELVETEDFETFHILLADVLKSNHKVSPVHSLEELKLLHERFKENIKLFMVKSPEGKFIAGTLLFINEVSVHAQYIASSEEGKQVSALDFLFLNLIQKYRETHRFFDFGISTESQGRVLNTGLAKQKEGFGARSVCHLTFEVNLNE